MAYRYLGNKARIADWICSVVKEYVDPGSTIADPMCGTATMSEAFAREGFRVIASDELTFPTLHAKSRLVSRKNLSFAPVARSYEEALSILNSAKPAHDFFWREYSDEGSPSNGTKPRRYFKGYNAARIDKARMLIREWRRRGLGQNACELLLNDLMLAANRVANIAGTYGYYCSTWSKASLKELKLEPTVAPQFQLEHSVLQGRIENIGSEIAADAFYIDPPYTKRQYGGNYHILETIAVEDDPLPVGDGGLRDWYGQASDFCYKRRVSEAFSATLRNISAPKVFISYSEDAHLPPRELQKLLSEFGSVSRHTIPLERFRSNSRVAKIGKVKEHLYVLEMSHGRTAKNSRVVVSKNHRERSLQHRKVAA